MLIIKYIPLQQGLRLKVTGWPNWPLIIIKYIPLQQGLRPGSSSYTLSHDLDY